MKIAAILLGVLAALAALNLLWAWASVSEASHEAMPSFLGPLLFAALLGVVDLLGWGLWLLARLL